MNFDGKEKGVFSHEIDFLLLKICRMKSEIAAAACFCIDASMHHKSIAFMLIKRAKIYIFPLNLVILNKIGRLFLAMRENERELLLLTFVILKCIIIIV